MMFLAIEAGLVVLAVVLAFTIPNLGSRWFDALERNLGNLARQRGLAVITVGLTAMSLRAALLPILPVPVPGVSDEFGYLLLSDTFAHGRLTNPPSPMWVHFETFQIIWHPTYTAKYYPAQGLIMAFGQAVMGHPFWGIWLSVGLMCAAITWMLQTWVGEGWALLGGFLAVIRFASFSYWDNSYWGGAMAAIGGALVLGALPRIKGQHHLRNALLMGLGFAILANSRPYEGLFFGIPVAVALLVWLGKLKRPELGRALKRAVVPLLAVLVLTLVAMGYYFWRTTGSPFNTPYFVYEHTYNPVPLFPWESLRRIPAYHHTVFQNNFLKYFALPQYQRTQSLIGLALKELSAGFLFWTFFLGPLLTLPLVIAVMTLPYGFSWKDTRAGTRFLLLVCGVTLAGEVLPTAYAPHYSAPITCIILALVLVALRRVQSLHFRDRPFGVFIVRAVPAIGLLLLILFAVTHTIGWPQKLTNPKNSMLTWCSLMRTNTERASMLAKLRRYPSRQLVIVRHKDIYGNNFFEWVYNRAELNSAKVIWARDMGPAKNQELIRYYKNRRVWLVDVDDQPPKLEPYSEATDLQQPTPTGKEP
jgi:hypothetical protein